MNYSKNKFRSQNEGAPGSSLSTEMMESKLACISFENLRLVKVETEGDNNKKIIN
jgi:hypothetical protein